MFNLFGQSPFIEKEPGDEKVRTSVHYVGIQINQLLKEIFNLSGNTEVFVNPYFINYQVNSINSGWGANVGLGYNLQKTETGTALSKVTTTIDRADVRLGVEKKTNISRKWLGSIGIDAIAGKEKNLTNSETNNGFGSSTRVETLTEVESLGGGPRASLHFRLSQHILIGTEISFYYANAKSTELVSQYDQFGNNTSFFESSPTTNNLVFLGPRYLLLTVNF